jgi:hypothetical protein
MNAQFGERSSRRDYVGIMARKGPRQAEKRRTAMARKTRLLTFLAAALVALTTVGSAGTKLLPAASDGFSVSVEMSAKVGAGVATSWQAP